MKLYVIKISHNSENFDKEYFVACNKIDTVINYPKKIGLHYLDYEIESVTLVANEVAIIDD